MNEIIRIEIYRQGNWQELPFPYLCLGDRYRPINGNTAGMIFRCESDATEHQNGMWCVSAKLELS
jgi:hypothetical protein